MSNAAEWYEDKWAEVHIWRQDPAFSAWLDEHALPNREVDRLFEIARLHREFERMQSEIKNQQ